MTNLVSHKEGIDELIIKYLPKSVGEYNKSVVNAMVYSMNNGGKRVRPLLMKASYLAVSKSNTDNSIDISIIEPFMVAIEMIHTYSLIHDDLPAMDNDDLRRGKATCHKVFGEANAILAGDGLLNLAFETTGKALLTCEKELDKLICLVRANDVLARNSGIQGMIGGQAADILYEKTSMISEDDLNYVYAHKTGALINSSLLIGGILAHADALTLDKLSIIGNNIGLAFQIQDDILDKTSTVEVFGKPIGSDDKNHKSTYLTYHPMEEAIQTIEKLSNEAMEIANSLKIGNNELLLTILRFLKERKY